jgi:hypothetical protein
LGKEFASQRERARVSAFDHRPRNDAGTGPCVGQTIQIDVVQNARAVERQRSIAEEADFFVTPMIRAKALGEAKHIVPGRGGDQHLYPHQIGAAARAAISINALSYRHRTFLLKTE